MKQTIQYKDGVIYYQDGRTFPAQGEKLDPGDEALLRATGAYFAEQFNILYAACPDQIDAMLNTQKGRDKLFNLQEGFIDQAIRINEAKARRREGKTI